MRSSTRNCAHEAIDVLLQLRGLDLAKKPGLSELLDWVGYLQAGPGQCLTASRFLAR